MTIRPPRRERANRTFVPSAERSSASMRSSSGSRSVPAPVGPEEGRWRRRRTSSSVSRTESAPSMTTPRTCHCPVSARPPRARRPGPGATHPRGDLLLAHPELLDEPAEGARLFQGPQIGAMKVFDEGELQLGVVLRLTDDGRDPLEAGQLGSPYAPLPRDEPVAVERLRHHDRLEDPVTADALDQRGERLRIVVRARLVGVARDARHGDLGAGGRAGPLRDQGGEPAAKAWPLRPCAHATAPATPSKAAARRAWNSEASVRYACDPRDDGLYRAIG